MRAARRRPAPPPKPAITPDQKLAYVICFWVYGRGCECRERARGQVCDSMRKAAQNARLLIEAERQ